MKTKIKIIITAIMAITLMMPLANVSAADTRPIAISKFEFVEGVGEVVSLVANDSVVELSSIEGNFPLTEEDGLNGGYYELVSMAPSEKLNGLVVLNDVNSGDFAAAISGSTPVSFNQGDVIWTAVYDTKDDLPFDNYLFTATVFQATFNSHPTLDNQFYYFGIAVVPPAHDVPILDGEIIQVWDSGRKKNITIRFDAALGYFKEVRVDGEVLGPENYNVSAGSTIVEFLASYLETLSAGDHSVEVAFSDNGIGRATIRIADPINPADSDTSDDSVVNVPDTGYFTGTFGSATAIGVGAFLGVALIPVVIAMSIERRYSRNKVEFDKK